MQVSDRPDGGADSYRAVDSSVGLFPHRHVSLAVGGEGIALPIAPPLAECETCDPRHEVIFRWPCVSVRRGEGVAPTLGRPIMMRGQSLVDNVVLVDSEVVVRNIERDQALSGWQATQCWDKDPPPAQPVRPRCSARLPETGHEHPVHRHGPGLHHWSRQVRSIHGRMPETEIPRPGSPAPGAGRFDSFPSRANR